MKGACVLHYCTMFMKLFYPTVLCVVAWIMNSITDLKSFVDQFKNDINELQAPMIRKGLVFYIPNIHVASICWMQCQHYSGNRGT